MTRLTLIASVNDLFDSLEPEDSQEERKVPEIVESPGLIALIDNFERILNARLAVGTKLLRETGAYDIVKIDLPPLDFNATDLFSFSMRLGALEKRFDSASWQTRIIYADVCGVYISALIKQGDTKSAHLHTAHLTTLPNFLGYENDGKDIMIQGNVGDYLAYNMKGGSLVVNGNVGGELDLALKNGIIKQHRIHLATAYRLADGKLTINGNIEGHLGDGMTNGKITVHGKVNGDVGNRMQGGAIHVYGTFEKLGDNMKGGDVYHNGQQLVKDGVRL